MNKPNLFIPGFPKSGTSALHDALCQSIHIDDGGIKEPHTYSWDIRYRKRDKIFSDKYKESNAKYILDSSTTYMVSQNAISRIVRDSPESKFIVIARDPVDRIVSHFNWLSSLGLIDREPSEEITEHLHRRFNYREHYNGNYKAYIDFSKYGEQLERMFEVVSKENFIFLTYDQLNHEFEEVMQSISSFLNIDLSNITSRKVNVTSFDKEKVKKKKKSLAKWILDRFLHEASILRGFPRSKKIRNPHPYSVKREEIESLLIPYLEDDLKKVLEFGFDIHRWPTLKKPSIN